MDDQTRRALSHGQTIDITTTGRDRSSRAARDRLPHLRWAALHQRTPGADRTRAWLLNLEADPHFTFHLKGDVAADLPATARVITDEAERRAVLADIVTVWKNQDLETMVRYSPLIEVTIDDLAA